MLFRRDLVDRPWCLAVAAAALACSGPSGPRAPQGGTSVAERPIPSPSASATPAPGPAGAPAAPAVAPTVPGGEGLAPESRVLVVTNGQERWMDAAAAEAAGYTIIDLRDDWTPFIFAEHHAPDGQVLPNRYRRVFIGLANDKLDEDGVPLPSGEKNYLELYGIPPSLSVVQARFLDDAAHPCHDAASVEKMQAVETVSYIAPDDVRKDETKLQRVRAELEAERHKAHLATLDELAKLQPKLEPKVKLLQRRALEKVAMVEVEKRLTCEGLLKPRGGHKTGLYDDAMRLAVRRFQQKHMIYESNYLRSQTMDALARPLLENDHQALLRVLRERVVSAAGILEDGTAEGKKGAPEVPTMTGRREPLHNLVDEYTKTAVEQLGLGDAEAALAFFRRHPAGELKTLRAAVMLPPRPDYYSGAMELSIVIDRGDIWYDPPFDQTGTFRPQARKKYPQLTLMMKYRNEQVPLVRWRTTIGGWRAEQASDGYEYFRYKGSDVGPRVIRQIVSGPVWIAPESTPIRSLTKVKTINGQGQRVVNYDELGPGYLSAYGLVAGYFVTPQHDGRPDSDNGIRAHGSSDYLSIYSANGFSHGCHRLPNHLAIRLYSFLLAHRAMKVQGDQPFGFSRQFLSNDVAYEIRIPSRGFVFELDPPLPVNVLEGEIKGPQKTPILTYVPKPGTRYPGPPPAVPNSPEARTAAAAGGAQ